MSNVSQIFDQARSRGDKALSEFDAKRVLAAYGIPVTREQLVGSAREAVAAATALGFPVALKGCGPTLLHKTEMNMVRLGLATPDAVRAAFVELSGRLPAGAAVLVQETVSGKRELIAGLVCDAQFGPCVSLGLGGIFAEALADVTFRVAPFGRAVALSMLNDLRLSKIFGAFRGMPPVDRDALANILAGLSQVAIDHPGIAEIDINPIIICGARPLAVDALIVLHGR